jgi:predicted acetyltransferase
MSVSEGAAVIRRGRSEDVEPILDLLAHYERPRSYFEPFYLKDPSYRPEHSWMAEQDGRLLAHLRVFDRKIWVGGPELRVAGVGNVITAPDQRGRGHAGGVLRAMLDEIPAEGFAYSLLRAYQPILYERHGWAPSIRNWYARRYLPPTSTPSRPSAMTTCRTLCASMMRRNAGRSGTTVPHPNTGGRS